MSKTISQPMQVLGNHAARRLFLGRARRGQRQVEIHITEADLALAMAGVAQAAWDAAIDALERARQAGGDVDVARDRLDRLIDERPPGKRPAPTER